MIQVLGGSCHSTQGNGISLMSPSPGAVVGWNVSPTVHLPDLGGPGSLQP